MKKFKHVVPFFLAMIMALAIPLAGCNSCGGGGDDDKKDVVTLVSVSVDASKAKTEYKIDDEFSSDGLVVTASFSNNTTTVCDEEEYTVDSSAFKNDVAGVYTIRVSCTFDNVTKDGSYKVTVYPNFEGLEVTFVEGTQYSYDLTSSVKTVEIDTTKIIVKEIKDDGTVGNAITDYTTKLFNGQEEIELTNGKATVKAGAYAIWAEKASDVTGFNRAGFVLVYVNDKMTGFEFKDGTLTQSAGIDVITDTWTFTATYVTGETKVISSKDCDFKADTFVVGSKSVVVSYTDYDAEGKKVTMTATVNYSATNPVPGTVLNYKFAFNVLTGVDGQHLKQTDFTGVNAFLTLHDPNGNDNKNYATYKESATAVEIKGIGFHVTFYGTGTITIGFASTGPNNSSTVGICDESNKYVATTTTGVTEYDGVSNTYLVTGTGTTELTFNITKAGTYKICAQVDSDNYKRGARVTSIVMEDRV